MRAISFVRRLAGTPNPARSRAMRFLEALKPVGLLFLRCALGTIFMVHGYPKLFGQNTAMHQSFAQHGLPRSFLFVAGVPELFCGGPLGIGLFGRAAALLRAFWVGVVLLKNGRPG